MASTSIARYLNFERPRTREHGVLEDANQVQPPSTATSVHIDPMDIVEAASNRPGTRPTNAINGNTEQVTAQNPPRPAPEIGEVGTKAIQLIQHLTGMVEQNDALNKHNHYKLNLLQRKIDERDQLILEKDATIVEKDGAINTYLSTIATLTQQLAELRLVRSTEERNATECTPHSDAALDILVANLAKAIVDPALTPPRPPSRQRTTSLLDNPGGQSRVVQDSQDSLSLSSLAPGLPITEVAASTANDQASTNIEEMVKLQEDNAKLKQELQTLQSNHDKLNEEFKSLTRLHYQWKLACLWTVDRNRQLALDFEKIDQQYKKNTQRGWGLTSWISPDDMFPWDNPLTIRTRSGHTILDCRQLGWEFENATSFHHLSNPSQAGQKLWATYAKFVFDGTTCCICYNAFGPEGGFCLGTCEHMYHPICLIAHMVIWRHCCQCKAPFHERLYELFGLCPYMPPSWEHNP